MMESTALWIAVFALAIANLGLAFQVWRLRQRVEGMRPRPLPLRDETGEIRRVTTSPLPPVPAQRLWRFFGPGRVERAE